VPGEASRLDAGALVGLLADEDRRRVVAALTLGATGLDDVARATGISVDRAGRALARLVDGGLVLAEDDGSLVVDGEAFRSAARESRTRPPNAEHAAESADRRKVLDAFVRDGRITSIPASHSKRLVLLDWLAQDFEPGHRYTEAQVNEILEHRHPDTASLRRYLVDEELLDRAAGEYWRIGGTVR
jgi:hypothetical protein